MKIDGKTEILGVLGYPVTHTLSPEIHNFLIQKYKLNLVYIPLEVQEHNFDAFIKNIGAINNFKGFNITVPYKVKSLAYMDVVSPEAEFIGAINTVSIKNNKCYGYNTDNFGFIKALEMNFPEFNLRNKEVLVLGAGGAAKAAAFSLLNAKIKKLVLMNRTHQKAVNLRNTLLQMFGEANIEVKEFNYSFLKTKQAIPHLIVNTTTYGLRSTDKDLIHLQNLKGSSTIVYDLIYNPKKTALLKDAEKYKLRTLNGKDMLVLQALKSFSIWTGISLEDELIKHFDKLRK